MSNEQPAPPLRLSNAFAGQPDPEKCYFTLPRVVHTYFFRRLFAGEHGTYQNLTSIFFSKLYDECQRAGLIGERAVWDPANERIVAEILGRLNFNAPVPPVPDSGGGPRKRRAAPRTNVPPGQPEPGLRNGRTT